MENYVGASVRHSHQQTDGLWLMLSSCWTHVCPMGFLAVCFVKFFNRKPSVFLVDFQFTASDSCTWEMLYGDWRMAMGLQLKFQLSNFFCYSYKGSCKHVRPYTFIWCWLLKGIVLKPNVLKNRLILKVLTIIMQGTLIYPCTNNNIVNNFWMTSL